MDEKFKKELNEIFKVEESRQHFMDLCKRKYSSMPDQLKKCTAAIRKRFRR